MATIGGYNVVTDGLVLSLDAANRRSYVSGSNTWFDVSGNNSVGSLTNGPGFNNSSEGSIVFDGVNDEVVLPANSLFDITGSFTINSFIKPNTGPWHGPILSNNSLSGYLFRLQNYGTGNFYLTLSTAGVWERVTGGSIPKDVWTNVSVVGTFGSSATLYINAVPISTNSIGTPTYNNAAVYIGGFTGYRVNGNIANVQLYNRALSATEIAQNYNIYKLRFGL
jgi:hypothetical protein